MVAPAERAGRESLREEVTPAVLAPSRRVRTVLVAAVLALLLILVARSTPRHVGDSAEYVAMSLNLARLDLPSLTSADLVEARSLFPGDAGVRLKIGRAHV